MFLGYWSCKDINLTTISVLDTAAKLIKGTLSWSSMRTSIHRKLENISLVFSTFIQKVEEEEILAEVLEFEDQSDYKKVCFQNHKWIYLKSKTFQSWLQAKFDAGYAACSDSDFTAHLLSSEYRWR